MKKIFTVFLCLLTLFSLASCGDEKETFSNLDQGVYLYCRASESATLRDIPSRSGERLATVKSREKVEYIDTCGEFFYVCYNGTYGFVLSDFFSSDKNAPLNYGTGNKPSSDTSSKPQEPEEPEEPEEPNAVILDVTPISQYPELPTGCEITALTMALNYSGVTADKCDLADNYLVKGPVGTVDFREAFEGDPRDPYSFGCYSPVIVNAANKYLSAKNSNLSAVDISGTELENLFEYIDNGTPVIVWGTRDCEPGRYSVTWTVNGKEIQWYTPEHCMLLVGYGESYVYVADPLYGELRSYEKSLFASRYNELQKQAVVIE